MTRKIVGLACLFVNYIQYIYFMFFIQCDFF